MTATAHDFIRLEGPAGHADFNCLEHDIDWPPPETITHIAGTELLIPQNRVSMSERTDQEAVADPTVHRGALYWPINYEPTGTG